jgi:hypothetical protein
MYKIEIKGNLKFPDMDMTKTLEHIAEKIIIPEIAGHIIRGTDLDDIPYQPLAESTVKRKGHDRPLIGEERRLFSASNYYIKSSGKNRIVIYIKAIRRDIAKYLQVEGVRSKEYGKRFFNFFGVNKMMALKADNVMQKAIQDKINGK